MWGNNSGGFPGALNGIFRPNVTQTTNQKTGPKKDSNKPGAVRKVKRPMAPLAFRLKLIDVVRKQDIIWDTRMEKNKHLLEAAWVQVKKAMKTNVEYCQEEWKKMRQQYSGYVNRKTSMKKELVDHLEFLRAHVTKAPGDMEKKDDSVHSGPAQPRQAAPATPKAASKPKKVSKQRSGEGSDQRGSTDQQGSVDRRSSLALINHLFDSVPSAEMGMVREALASIFVRLKPQLYKSIVERGQNQTGASCMSFKNIDWAPLGVDEPVCQAIWDYHVRQLIIKSKSALEKK